MFRSLLRTIPTLTGNVKLNCHLTEFNKIDNDTFESFVRVADLSPLQNSLFNRNIKLSLLTGSYEFDVSKYYQYYSHSFYSENYSFNKNDYQTIDITEDYIDCRNKDYEFGCKRIQFYQTGFQFNFFAPIYCDDINDLPDYFNIVIKIKNLEKVIKVYIGKKNNRNYLSGYLSRFIGKLGKNVIKLNAYNKSAVYHGIDVSKGGIVSNNDFIIRKIFNTQVTLNDYDALINNGFKRNNMVLGQIIPLSFSFNIKDILSSSELKYFIFNEANINGVYKSDNINYTLYDFDVDYYNFNIKKMVYNYDTSKYTYITSDKNLMDIEYPGLREKRYINYKYANKVSPVYNRWALYLNNNYIINSNYIYNSVFNSNNNYGEFPSENNYNLPTGNLLSANHIFLPYGSFFNNNRTLNNYYIENNKPTKNLENFIYHMNNYETNWFDIYNYVNDSSDPFKKYERLFNTDTYFENVLDNKIMYKGIIYDFHNIVNKAGIEKIDKFGLFINPIISDVNKNKKYIFAKNLINKNSDSKSQRVYINENISTNKAVNIFISPQENDYENKEYHITFKETSLENDILLYEDNIYGNYIEYNYYESNNYYLLEDIKSFFGFNKGGNIFQSKFYAFITSHRDYLIDGNNINKIIENIYYVLNDLLAKNYIDGDILLPFLNNKNGYYYSSNNFNEGNKNRVTKNYLWCEDFLLKDYINYKNYNNYFSFISNNIKYSNNTTDKHYVNAESIDTIVSDYNNINLNFNYKFYICKKLVSLTLLLMYFEKSGIINNIEIFKNALLEEFMLNNYICYNYYPIYKDDDDVIGDYFMEYDNRYDIMYNEDSLYKSHIINNLINNETNNKYYQIYVDNYNLNNLISSINNFLSDKSEHLLYYNDKCKCLEYNGKKYKDESFFSKFLNKNHLIDRYSRSIDDERFLYVKHRELTFDDVLEPNDIKFQDKYYKIVINNEEVINNEDNLKLNSGNIIVYDDKKYTQENADKFIYINSTSTAYVLKITIDDFINCISDVSNKQGIFNFYHEYIDNNLTKIIFDINLELYFRDVFYNLPMDIYEKITCDEYDEYFGLYIYRLNNDSEYNNSIMYDSEIYDELENLEGGINNHLSRNNYKYNINVLNNSREENKFNNIYNNSLTPIFIDLYNSEENNYYINYLFDSKTIRKYDCDINENIIYNDYNYPMVVDLSLSPKVQDLINEFVNDKNKYADFIINYPNFTKNNLLPNYINDENRNDVKKKITEFVLNPTTEDHYIVKQTVLESCKIYSNIKLSEIDFINETNVKNIININEDNLNIYQSENGLNYAFYLLDVKISPLIKNFNVNNNISGNIIIDKINNKNFDIAIKYDFKYIYPYILNVNLLDKFTENNKLIKKYSKLHIDLNFLPKRIENINNTNIDNLYKGIHYDVDDKNKNVYKIVNNDMKNNYFNILRYYDDIIPYFVNKSNNIINNRFNLCYKVKTNKTSNENNIIKTNINIYNYNGILVKDNFNVENTVKEYEYKHFNDNKFYVLPEEINILVGSDLLYTELLAYEKPEKIKQEFKKYLLKITNTDDINNDELLFLFNRYNVNLLSNSTKLNSFKTEKLYDLKYKFILK